MLIPIFFNVEYVFSLFKIMFKLLKFDIVVLIFLELNDSIFFDMDNISSAFPGIIISILSFSQIFKIVLINFLELPFGTI